MCSVPRKGRPWCVLSSPSAADRIEEDIRPLPTGALARSSSNKGRAGGAGYRNCYREGRNAESGARRSRLPSLLFVRRPEVSVEVLGLVLVDKAVEHRAEAARRRFGLHYGGKVLGQAAVLFGIHDQPGATASRPSPRPSRRKASHVRMVRTWAACRTRRAAVTPSRRRRPPSCRSPRPHTGRSPRAGRLAASRYPICSC